MERNMELKFKKLLGSFYDSYKDPFHHSLLTTGKGGVPGEQIALT